MSYDAAFAAKLSLFQFTFWALSICSDSNSSGVRTSKICGFSVVFIFSANSFGAIDSTELDFFSLQEINAIENVDDLIGLLGQKLM